jgi:RIO kinase 1
VYREGRGLLDENGHGVRVRDRRAAQAIRKGTRYGKRLSHTSWVMHEYETLRMLHAAGGSVPEPIAATTNAVLMEFVGDERGAAPTLDGSRPNPDEARILLEDALRNIQLLLSFGLVHGDLSPYNLLLWERRLYVIDLPQVCDVLGNPNALALFHRDVERVCDGFRRCGVSVDARATADDLWDRVFDTDEGVPETAIAPVVPFDLKRWAVR